MELRACFPIGNYLTVQYGKVPFPSNFKKSESDFSSYSSIGVLVLKIKLKYLRRDKPLHNLFERDYIPLASEN